jgi:hypothetical protein
MKADAPSALEGQTPPQGAAALEQWLASGAYKDWQCEEAPHASRSPSPHGYNRICSNDVIASHADGKDAWPKGAAAVKELYTSEETSEPMGYSVYVKTQRDSANGANWYWYERLPDAVAAEAMIEDTLVADGMGDSGNAKNICVACHAAAGSDPVHTPSSGGRDQVYTPVR